MRTNAAKQPEPSGGWTVAPSGTTLGSFALSEEHAGSDAANQQTIARLDKERIEKLVKSGTANAGMVAKLAACQVAIKGGAMKDMYLSKTERT